MNTRSNTSNSANINKRRPSVSNENTTICDLCRVKIVKSVNELKEKIETITTIPENLTNLQELTNTLLIKTTDIKASIEANTKHIQALEKEVASFKISGPAQDASQLSITHTVKCEVFEFGLNHEGNHVLLPSKALESNPTKEMEEYKAEFLPSSCRNELAKFLTSKNSSFESSGSSHLLFGEQPTHQRSEKAKKEPMPKALLECIDLICSYYPNSGRPNSVEITKYTGNSATPAVCNNELYTVPQSHIFTINIGDPCDIIFMDRISGTEITHQVSDNSLYVTTQTSKDFYMQRLSKTSCADASVYFSITFRSVDKSCLRSTCLIGDSNTRHVYFNNDDSKRSIMGKSIYRKRVYAPLISDVDYRTCMGFRNVILHVGINELKYRNRSDTDNLSVEDVFNNYLNCLVNLRKYCPNAKFFISPILPTRIRALNTKVLQFNYTLFACTSSIHNSFTTQNLKKSLQKSRAPFEIF